MRIMQFLQWIEHYSIVFMFVMFVMILATHLWPGRKASASSVTAEFPWKTTAEEAPPCRRKSKRTPSPAT